MSVNKFIGIGNITKDPETRYLPNGDAVTNCSIACNETWKNKDGEKQEKVEFINLVFFKRLAEIVAEYCKKGAQIYVEGKITTEKWTDKEGKDRYTTKIVCHEMKMLGGKKESAERAEPAKSEPASENKTGSKSFDNFDDDIPFAPHGKNGAGVGWRMI